MTAFVQVAKFLKASCVVHYCSYGGQFFKPTQLWSGPAPFSLEESGFVPGLCGGATRCRIMVQDVETRRWRHPEWEGTSLSARQAIPSSLSYSVGHAICVYLNKQRGLLPARVRGG